MMHYESFADSVDASLDDPNVSLPNSDSARLDVLGEANANPDNSWAGITYVEFLIKMRVARTVLDRRLALRRALQDEMALYEEEEGERQVDDGDESFFSYHGHGDSSFSLNDDANGSVLMDVDYDAEMESVLIDEINGAEKSSWCLDEEADEVVISPSMFKFPEPAVEDEVPMTSSSRKSRRFGGHFVKAAGEDVEGAWYRIGSDGLISD
ncbi:hypothetical protein OE88DRAFT_481536 [Heliocybe sulcata]|uniref:Uncharacterized protein n=1 Tax=Heliocybe sulcata TaxID=5364 RepID=A0A5C3MUY2_9AGAM|nr:hypothetical protein OE88DRAFT_1359528 [Heliocybe sulcata]TFK48602.1 hypothetical protein OE88DRAFT_481536 [Heliocybe sulcata]